MKVPSSPHTSTHPRPTCMDPCWMHFGPSNRADRKTTEREGSTMCGGPLCTKTFSTERGGQKKKKRTWLRGEWVRGGAGTLYNSKLFFYFCTMQRGNVFFFLSATVLSQKHVFCARGRGGQTHTVHNIKQLRSRLENAFAEAIALWLHTPKRWPPRSTFFFFNATNKNATSKWPRRRHHRFQWGT